MHIIRLAHSRISHTANVSETERGHSAGLGPKTVSPAKYKVLAPQIYLLVLHSPGKKTIQQL